jgi:hypothetical protein
MTTKRVVFLVVLFLCASLAVLAWVWLSEGGETGSSGLKIVLRARQAEFRLGEPMRFEYLAVNRTFHTVARDCQDIDRDPFEIRDPDGEIVPWTVFSMSTWGSLRKFRPFIDAYRREIDIVFLYAFTREGEYTIKVRKKADDLCESNTVRFTVRGGTVPVADEILPVIRKVLPADWRAGKYPQGFVKGPIPGRAEGETIWIPMGKEGRRVRIDLILSKTEAPEREPLLPREERSIYLGKNHLGYFYAQGTKEANETWPDHVQALRGALGLKEK